VLIGTPTRRSPPRSCNPLGLACGAPTVVGDRKRTIRRRCSRSGARGFLHRDEAGPTRRSDRRCAAQAKSCRCDAPALARAPPPALGERPANSRCRRTTCARRRSGSRSAGKPRTEARRRSRLRIDRCLFFFLPGVPRGSTAWREMVIPPSSRPHGNAVLRSRILQCYGVTESKLDEIVAGIRKAHPEVRFGSDEVPENISRSPPGPDAQRAEPTWPRWSASAGRRSGRHLRPGRRHVRRRRSGKSWRARKRRICCAETARRASLTQMLTSAGSSRWTLGASSPTPTP